MNFKKPAQNRNVRKKLKQCCFKKKFHKFNKLFIDFCTRQDMNVYTEICAVHVGKRPILIT